MNVLELLLDYLPERYVDAVVNNMKDRSQLFKEASSFPSELMSLFDWHDSREGYDFWYDVLDSALTDQTLPVIPITINYCPSTIFICNDRFYVMNAAGTEINIVYELKNIPASKMDPYKKEKIFAFLN